MKKRTLKLVALLAHHAKIDLKDKSGFTALHWANSLGRTNAVPLLQQAGARE